MHSQRKEIKTSHSIACSPVGVSDMYQLFLLYQQSSSISMNPSQKAFQTFGKGMNERPGSDVFNDLKYHLTPDNLWYFWIRETIKYPLLLLTVPRVIPFAFTMHVTALPATEVREKLREGGIAFV